MTNNDFLTPLDFSDIMVDWKIGGIADPLGQIASWITLTIGGYINSAVNTIKQGVQSIISSAVGGISSIVNSISSNIGSIINVVNNLPNTVRSALSGISTTISSALSPIINQVSSILSGVSGAISTGFNSIINSITNNINGLKSFISSLPSIIQNSLSSLGSSITNTISRIISTISGLGSTLSGAISTGFNTFMGGLTNIYNTLKNIGTEIYNNISKVIVNLIDQVKTSLSGIGTTLSNSISLAFKNIQGGFNSFTDNINKIFKPIIDTLNNFGKWITGEFIDFAKNPKEYLTTALGDIGKKVWSLIPDWLQNGIKKIEDIYKYLSGEFLKFINDPKGFITGALADIGKKVWELLPSWLQDGIKKIETIAGYFSGEFLNFTKDPKGFINNSLTSLGLPTLNDIYDKITGFFKTDDFKKLFKDVLGIPDEFLAFIKLGAKFLNKLLESHSPSALDNIIDFIKIGFGKITLATWNQLKMGGFGGVGFFITNFLGLYYDVKEDDKGNLIVEQKKDGGLNALGGITDYFTNLGSNVIKGLTDIGKTLYSDFLVLGNWMVDNTISLFNMPTPSSTAKDPFSKLSSSLMQTFTNMAKLSTSKTPIVSEVVFSVTSEISGVTVFSEALEYLGLTVDQAHPLKNMGLREKIEKFFQKIGLGNVTGIIGATLISASLRPLLERWFNKQSQVQLPSPNILIDMFHRNIFDKIGGEKTLDIYLSETGLDATFRKGFKELAYRVIDFNTMIESYLRKVNDEEIDIKKAETEITKYLDILDYKDVKRDGYSFSDKELIANMIYRNVSRFERRSLNATGILNIDDLKKVLLADRLKPDLVDKLANAEFLQGSLTYRNQIASKLIERFTKGYIVSDEFIIGLKDADFTDNIITYFKTANELDLQTTIDESRLKEAVTNYTNGYSEKPDFEKIVNDIIKNKDIAKEYIDISDIARKRFDKSLVRDEQTKIESLTLAFLGEGSMTDTDFIKVGMGLRNKALSDADVSKIAGFEKSYKAGSLKINDYSSNVLKVTGSEELALLIEAGAMILQSKIKAVKFKTLQTRLAKNYMTPTEFISQCQLLPMNKELATATSERIIIQLMPKRVVKL